MNRRSFLMRSTAAMAVGAALGPPAMSQISASRETLADVIYNIRPTKTPVMVDHGLYDYTAVMKKPVEWITDELHRNPPTERQTTDGDD